MDGKPMLQMLKEWQKRRAEGVNPLVMTIINNTTIPEPSLAQLAYVITENLLCQKT